MASQMHLREFGYAADADGELLEPRFENLVASPIASASLLDNGADYPGQYKVTVLAGGVTVTVAAEGDDATKNPYSRTPVSIVADGATPNDEVIPGLRLVFPAGLAAGHEGRVVLGDFLDPGTKLASRRLNAGVVVAGVAGGSTQRKMIYVNLGDATGTDCELDVVPRVWLRGTDAGHSTFIKSLRNHYAEAYEHAAVADDYELSFANYVPGAPSTTDVYVKRTGDPVPVKAIENAKLDGSTAYYYGDGHGYVDVANMLPGMRIVFQNEPGDPTAQTFLIRVFPGFDLVQLALDVAGVPGSWVSPPLQMTDGDGVAGIVKVGMYDVLWVKYLPDVTEVPGTHRVVRFRCRHMTI